MSHADEALSGRARAWLAAGAVLVLVVTFGAIWRYWPADYAGSGGDLPIYYGYGRPALHGDVPYRDYEVLYPPAALPVFMLPVLRPLALGSTDGALFAQPIDRPAYRYMRAFSGLMIALLAAAVVFTSISLARLRRSRGATLGALGVLALAPLLLGGLLYLRWDLWPAALTAAAMAALLSDRPFWAAGALGLGIAAKLYPAVLVPLAVAYVWRRRGRGRALATLAVTAGVVALVFLPFLVVAPRELAHALRLQVGRGLEVESVGSAALVGVGRLLGGLGVHGASLDALGLHTRGNESGLKTQELHGTGTQAASVVLGLIRAGVLVALWTAFARGEASRERLVRYCAAAVVATVALSQVLSPEYMMWLLPLVPLVGGRRGLVATVLTAAAVVVTHVWYPRVFDHFVAGLTPGSTGLLLLRDLLLLGTLAVLALPGPAPSARAELAVAR